MNRLLTVKEVSEKLGVHRRTILNWIKKGDLPFVRVGYDYRIDPEDLVKKRNE